MEVQIISQEIIKPSAPTPHHLRTYKLSGKDQIAALAYVPVILFYSPTNEMSSKNSDYLKKAFSETLTLFYPFAGRIKDELFIDCNDDGAAYIEARVTCNMSVMLQQPDIHQLEQLLPCKPDENLDDLSTRVMLAVQVNYFDCGGIAVSVSISHRVADGSSLVSFVKCWAAISCGVDHHIVDGVVVDCTSLFPPQDLSGIKLHESFRNDNTYSKTVTKRIEAVSALMWGAFVGEENESKKVYKVAAHNVDLRKRLDPPLPQHCIGNIIHTAMAKWPAKVVYADSITDQGLLAQIVKDPNNWSLFGFSRWCKFPFYEVDLGFGKPIWVGTAMRLMPRGAFLLDTRDGEGIEAWVTLSEEAMLKFEKNPDILAYASVSPRI
ncbi:minovincinine 19-hydroxy-O-acetyltransferase [Populus trichocarpa]|uniref:minovincinine 19-hydroxy-O-acetyltransferase n=1 Tax=Populus trichocarpa TaxID=3694 RepID=UPI000CCD4483|nr:minovincinine 19-hydroxy-O-acetyltransferase [Populus trichocarpa]|eukprot:XP_024460872.1 salutaridinol 7-O-acetyltransferase [Populus trichocarpa]